MCTLCNYLSSQSTCCMWPKRLRSVFRHLGKYEQSMYLPPIWRYYPVSCVLLVLRCKICTSAGLLLSDRCTIQVDSVHFVCLHLSAALDSESLTCGFYFDPAKVRFCMVWEKSIVLNYRFLQWTHLIIYFTPNTILRKHIAVPCFTVVWIITEIAKRSVE